MVRAKAAESAEAAENEALEELRSWLAEGDALRERLVKELEDAERLLDQAASRVKRLHAALALLSRPAVTAHAALALEEGPDLSAASNSDAIILAVGAHELGASASDVRNYVVSHGKELSMKYVHTYLHRLLRDGRLREGARDGRRVYFLSDRDGGSMREG